MRTNKLKKEYVVFMMGLLILLWSQVVTSSTRGDRAIFEKLFAAWTIAFNSRELAKSCNLFSVGVVADYRGIRRKNYTSICDGFKKVFADTSRRYHYSFKLHEIYQSGPLAAVRITWYLKITNKNGSVLHIQDEGLDILERGGKSEWKIINYLGYAKDKSEI